MDYEQRSEEMIWIMAMMMAEAHYYSDHGGMAEGVVYTLVVRLRLYPYMLTMVITTMRYCYY